MISVEREGSRGKLWSRYDYAPEGNLSVAGNVMQCYFLFVCFE